MKTIAELLREHVSLDLECVDRVYRNGYIPALQSSGGLVYFLEHHRAQVIASPAVRVNPRTAGEDMGRARPRPAVSAPVRAACGALGGPRRGAR